MPPGIFQRIPPVIASNVSSRNLTEFFLHESLQGTIYSLGTPGIYTEIYSEISPEIPLIVCEEHRGKTSRNYFTVIPADIMLFFIIEILPWILSGFFSVIPFKFSISSSRDSCDSSSSDS